MRILAPLITGTVLSAGGAAVISLRNPAPAQFAPPSWSSQRYHEIAHSSYGLEVLGLTIVIMFICFWVANR